MDNVLLRSMIEPDHRLSQRRQCELLGVNRSMLYYHPAGESQANLELMKQIDKLHTARPYYGVQRIWAKLRLMGHSYNIKRIRRLMRLMDIQTIYRRPNTSKGGKDHKIYPYLLRGLSIDRPNQVWCSDITYIPVEGGFFYLVAVMDWYSRFVLSWALSNTLTVDFCIDALQQAFRFGKPDIFNTDQGSQFTANDFTACLLNKQIQISMDGKGRCFDNIFIERLWRSLKYEEVYLNQYLDGQQAYNGISKWIKDYNEENPHQALNFLTPKSVYFNEQL